MATAKEQLKDLFPFLQRATEMEKVDKKVAYYCRMHALDCGMKIPNRCQETTEFLVSIMAQLEADKPHASLASDPTEDVIHLQNFALRIFNNGDRADRAGRSDKQTAQSLYASSIFFEILRQFSNGELESDLAEKQRYAAWRAAEINTALKQGRQPNPPPSGQIPDTADGHAGAEGGFAGGQPPPPPELRGPAAASFPQPPASSSGAAFGGAFGAPGAADWAASQAPPQLPTPPHFQPPPQPRASPSRPSVSPSKPAPPPGFKAPVLTEVSSAPSSSGLPVEALGTAQKAAK